MYLYFHLHVFQFKHLADQRALGMSMRVERASLEQVEHLSLCVSDLDLQFEIKNLM